MRINAPVAVATKHIAAGSIIEIDEYELTAGEDFEPGDLMFVSRETGMLEHFKQ